MKSAGGAHGECVGPPTDESDGSSISEELAAAVCDCERELGVGRANGEVRGGSDATAQKQDEQTGKTQGKLVTQVRGDSGTHSQCQLGSNGTSRALRVSVGMWRVSSGKGANAGKPGWHV